MNKELPARADLQPTIAELKAMPFGHVIEGASNMLERVTEFSVEDLEDALLNASKSQPEK